MSKAKFKKLNPEAVAPSYAKPGDAGMDLFTPLDGAAPIHIYPGERRLVKTGLAIELEPGFEGQVRSKSGRALKEGLMVLNSPGTIDAGYRGEVCAILYNSNPPGHGAPPITILPGQPIAQLVVKPVEQAEIEIVDELSESDRGTGGFGSTGLEARKP
jgi:dUTP pyrophosphatase